MNSMTSDKIIGMLSERYMKPEWAFFVELADSTGMWKSRTIDAYAVCCYSKPKIGHAIAFEVKISRADFMNEIRDPSKRLPFVSNSNEFYFVTPPNLLRPDEIPTDCGLMECGDTIRIKKIAPQRTCDTLDAGFVASLLRRNDQRNPQIWKCFKYEGMEITSEEVQDILKKSLDEYKREIRRSAESAAYSRLLAEKETEYGKFIEEFCQVMQIDIKSLISYRFDMTKFYNYKYIIDYVSGLKECKGIPPEKIKIMKNVLSRLGDVHRDLECVLKENTQSA